MPLAEGKPAYLTCIDGVLKYFVQVSWSRRRSDPLSSSTEIFIRSIVPLPKLFFRHGARCLLCVSAFGCPLGKKQPLLYTMCLQILAVTCQQGCPIHSCAYSFTERVPRESPIQAVLLSQPSVPTPIIFSFLGSFRVRVMGQMSRCGIALERPLFLISYQNANSTHQRRITVGRLRNIPNLPDAEWAILHPLQVFLHTQYVS